MIETAFGIEAAQPAAELDSVAERHTERRRYRRFSTALEASVYWQDEFGLPCYSPATVRDVSVGGFGIELDLKVPLGALVTVALKKRSIVGVVRHMRPHQNNVLIGVEMAPSADGSTATQSLARLAAALSP